MASDCLLARSRFTAKNTPTSISPPAAAIIPHSESVGILFTVGALTNVQVVSADISLVQRAVTPPDIAVNSNPVLKSQRTSLSAHPGVGCSVTSTSASKFNWSVKQSPPSKSSTVSVSPESVKSIRKPCSPAPGADLQIVTAHGCAFAVPLSPAIPAITNKKIESLKIVFNNLFI